MFDWYRNMIDKDRAQYMEYWLQKIMSDWNVTAEQIEYKGKLKWVATVKYGAITRHYAKVNGAMTELNSGLTVNDLRN